MQLRFLISLILVLAGLHSMATHMSGGEIYWECIGPNTYRIKLVVYRDCAGINVDASYNLQLTSPCGNRSLTVTTTGGTEISQLCDLELPNSTCNGGTLPGIQQYIYTGTIVLPSCNSWSIRWTNIYRNNAIVNLANPGTQEMFIEAVMNNAAAPCNDSPVFTNTAIPYVCLGYPVTFSYGAVDPEADSLSYALIGARKLNGNAIPYVAPNTPAVPIPGLVIDPGTGQISFTLNTAGNWVVVVRVTQYNGAGQVIGTIMRDMQFVAYPCDNIPPDAATGLVSDLTGTAIQTGPRAVEVCESGNFCFEMVINDVDVTNVLTAFSNIEQNLPGATFSYSGTNPITVEVCWTALPNSSGFFPFIVNVNDGACPIPAIQTYIYSVRVRPGVIATIEEVDESCLGADNGSLTTMISAGTAPYTYSWSNGSMESSIVGGPGEHTVTIEDSYGCVSHVLTGTIGTAAYPNEAEAGADVTVCMDQLPVQLNGTVVNATQGQWSGGSGQLVGTGLQVEYIPSAADIQAGSVQLTLTTTDNTGCPPATDDITINLPNSFIDATVTSTDATCYGATNGLASFSPADPTFTYSWDDPQAQDTPVATDLGAGTYNVTVVDTYGCSITLPANIGPNEPLNIVEVQTTDETCLGVGDGSATVTVTGGTAPYTFEWTGGTIGPSITATAGTYTIAITDANGCAPVIADVTINAAAIPNVADGGGDEVYCIDAPAIQLNGSVTNATSGIWSGGSGTFSGTGLQVSYMPSADDIQQGNVTLTLTTTGNEGCPPATDDIVVTIPNSFADGMVEAIDATCFDVSNGSAIFTPALPQFTYLWDDPAAQTTATATGLGAGPVSVTVNDEHGCNMTLPALIGPPGPLTITELTWTDEVCLGNGDGTATATVSGGTLPYAYTWSNGGTDATITAASGTYSVSITDANGCTPATGDVTIGAASLPNAADAGGDLVYCTDDPSIQLNGSITNATSGVWSGGSEIFTGTGPQVEYLPSLTDIQNGSVTLTLTTTGNNGCPPASDEMVISIPNSFMDATVTSIDASCFDVSDGSASFAPQTPGFAYQWDVLSATTPTVTGLGAGTYNVLVTDAYGCDITLPATIGPPGPMTLVGISSTDEVCLGAGNGTAEVNVTGGTAPYAYTWSNGGTDATITATSGTYSVSITDANGCSPVIADVTIGAAAQPNEVYAGPDQIVCMDDQTIDLNGTVVNATDGSWSGGSGAFTGTGLNVQYTVSADDVTAGSVTLTLTSIGNDGCPVVSDQIALTIPNSFAIGIISTVDATCYEVNNGTATYSPAGPGLSFVWNDPSAQTTSTATGLSAGDHLLTVTDAYGCSIEMPAFIGPASPITIAELISEDENCLGSGDGNASVVVVGGTAPYTYAWSNGSDQPAISGPSGDYTVAISDANGCAPTIGEITIGSAGLPNLADAGGDMIICMNTYPVQLQGSVTNATSGTWTGGNGVINGNGLVAEYWPTINEILDGNVELVLTTTGNETCPSASDTVQLTLANSFFNASLAAESATCHAFEDGTLTFTPDNNTFSYVWSAPGAGNSAIASGLGAGNYSVTVTDALGCDSTFHGVITEPDTLILATMNGIDASCHNGTNGQATLEITGGTAPYSAVWSNGSNGLMVNNLSAGTHTATITDQNGCFLLDSVSIGQPEPITLQAFIPDTVCVNAPVMLSAQAQGGNGDYQFNWSGIGTGDSLLAEFTETQFVFLSVTDGNGCSAPSLIEPVYVLDLSLADFSVYGNATVCAGEEVTIGATVNGYPGSYAISWPQLYATGAGPFTFPLDTGFTAQVILSNSCGDSQSETITLVVDVPTAVQLPTIIAQGCAPLTVQFPNPQLASGSWIWDLGNGQTSTAAAPMVTYQAGTYTATLTVTTPFGCSSTVSSSGQIISHTTPTAAFTASAYVIDLDNALINFTNQSTGGVTAQNWNFGDGGTSAVIDPQYLYNDIGTFLVDLTVQNAHGCTNTVTQPIQVTPVYDITLPNAFTPNTNGGTGGGYSPYDLNNDVFYAFVRHVDDFRMRIFNRWGELVFESSDLMHGWDGYYRGQLSQQDVYVVQTWIRFVDGREIQKLSDLTLLR